MLRYLEARGLVVPERSASGYRLYGLGQLNRLMGLTQLRTAHGVGIDEIAFAARLRREPELRREVDAWLAAGDDAGSWIDWEQRKHQRLLAA
jgi:DNA-binding transcriptional MerR regulator